MGRVIENFVTDELLTLLTTAEETGGELLKVRPATAPPAGDLVLYHRAGFCSSVVTDHASESQSAQPTWFVRQRSAPGSCSARRLR